VVATSRKLPLRRLSTLLQSLRLKRLLTLWLAALILALAIAAYAILPLTVSK
jgi:hypothetical protein